MRTHLLIRITLSTILFSLLLQCSSDQPESTANAPKVVPVKQNIAPVRQFKTLEAIPADRNDQIQMVGRLQALEEIPIVAEVQGKALPTKQLFIEQTYYRKGDLLIQIDRKQFEIDLKAQKSAFKSALVRIMSTIKLDYPEAHPAWDTYLMDFNEAEILPELPKIENKQLDFFLSANNIFTTFYQIKSLEELLPKYTIYAPYNGVLTQANISEGAIINPGSPLGRIMRTDVYEFKAAISEDAVDQVKPGQKLKITSRNSTKSWVGTVNRIGQTIDPASQDIPVFIRMSGRGLRPGMFLEANLEGHVLENVVEIPAQALTRNNEVYLIEDSTVVLKAVQVLQNENLTLLVSGLAPGDQVIVDQLNEQILGVRAIAR